MQIIIHFMCIAAGARTVSLGGGCPTIIAGQLLDRSLQQGHIIIIFIRTRGTQTEQIIQK